MAAQHISGEPKAAACISGAPGDTKASTPLMRRRHGSTCGYAPSEDLETGVRRSGATDHRADGATTRALQLPLRLIPSFRRPHAFSAHSDRPETRQERRVQVIRRAHSESERVVTRITLNNTKTTLVVFKSLTACADISELYKRLPRVGLASGKCKSPYLVLMCLETFFKSLLRQKVVRHFK